jgi:hypothetical protein
MWRSSHNGPSSGAPRREGLLAGAPLAAGGGLASGCGVLALIWSRAHRLGASIHLAGSGSWQLTSQ